MPGKGYPPAARTVTVRRIPFELLFWVAAILALAVSNPMAPHYSLCVFRFLGWHHCPGCGLGHAIGFLLRGNLSASWQRHPLGAFAVVVIFCRIADLATPYYILLRTRIIRLKKDIYGHKRFLVFPGH